MPGAGAKHEAEALCLEAARGGLPVSEGVLGDVHAATVADALEHEVGLARLAVIGT